MHIIVRIQFLFRVSFDGEIKSSDFKHSVEFKPLKVWKSLIVIPIIS